MTTPRNLPVDARGDAHLCDEDGCTKAARWALLSVLRDEDGRTSRTEDLCFEHATQQMHSYEAYQDDPEAVLNRSWELTVYEFVPVPEPEWEPCPHGLSLALCADPVNHYPPDDYPF